MIRPRAVFLCAVGVLAMSAIPLQAQVSPSVVQRLQVAEGSILEFHLQTRLQTTAQDPLDALPQGTAIHVRVLRPVDSAVDRDGSEFEGTIVSDLALGSGIVIHAGSGVRGLLVLLRSRNHPEGFRYELLLTELADHGKFYPFTASLDSSVFDTGIRPANSLSVPSKIASKTSPTRGKSVEAQR